MNKLFVKNKHENLLLLCPIPKEIINRSFMIDDYHEFVKIW